MSKRSLSLLTINSITALSKVCSSTNPYVSFKTLYFSNNLSTAAQRSDLSNSVDDPLQNPIGSYAESQINSNDFLVHKPSGNGLNPNWGFRETSGTVIGNSQFSQFGNSGGFYTHNNGGSYQNFSDLVDRKGDFGGYNAIPDGQFPYNHKEVSSWNSGSLHGHSKGVSGRNLNVVQNVMEASHVSNNPNVEGNLDESSDCISGKGTLEEFDFFCKENNVKEAVQVLHLFEEKHVSVDLPRLMKLMQVCGEAKALEEAKAVHDHIVRSHFPLSVSTSNKIIEMYAKCGDMNAAFAVFSKMPKLNLTSWDTMISWLAKKGLGEDAIDLFSNFKQTGLVPDAKLFIGVFSACGAVGDVNEGMLHFESMRNDYGIVPSMEHFVSIVDMMGTTGYLDEALEFIEKMPMEPSIDVWETLMNLSRIHGNLELGDRCGEIVQLLDPSRLNEQSKAGLVPVKVSDLTKEKEKKASQNLLEVRSKVHEYRAGDKSHPETERIYAMLRGLRAQMKENGYIPETRFVLHDVDQECKEDALLSHSERLATAHVLISSPARTPVRVIKNLRVCGDCHSALKIISKIVGRELIMRDAKRFHHFKDGVCSCRDYW